MPKPSRAGRDLGGGSGRKVNIKSQLDVWSYRHNKNNEPFVDAINTSIQTVQNDFPDIMNYVEHVNAAELGDKDAVKVLGFFQEGTKTVALNENYTDIDKMNSVYDKAVKTKYHPSRGSKSGTEATTFHEMGHAITAHLADKTGQKDFDAMAKTIVDNAYKTSGGRFGTKRWAGRISGYAQKSNAECIAEAFADYYCNGEKASKQSKAIIAEMKKY